MSAIDPQPVAEAAPENSGSSLVPPTLLHKLKLLPLRERELSTLRQIHQHHLLWIQATQELMVQLSIATAIPEALDALLESLVDKFGFDVAISSASDSTPAGDPIPHLTEQDHALILRVVNDVQRSKALVIANGDDLAGERTLAWLMADVVGSADAELVPAVVVGRTLRTAPYYPAPDAQEAGLYRHLLSTVTQVFRSISLQAKHNSELERKVIERTAELKEVQRRLVQLEREKITEQMAGGFAHEMRNALSGAKLVIEKGMGSAGDDERSLIDQTASVLKQIFLRGRETLEDAALEELQGDIRSIARNERLLNDILCTTNRSLVRALAITTQIMEYSRLGYSERGADPVDLLALVKNVLTESSEVLEKHGILATVKANGTCLLRGDETHVYSVFKNLIVNAIDALCETAGNRPRLLSVELEAQDRKLTARISDTADGIPDAIHARIFEPFFSTKPQTGTGLGLGVVQKLAALHEGTLEIDTTLGRGTTFTLCFSNPEQCSTSSTRASEGEAAGVTG